MIIKILKSCSGYNFSFTQGTEVDIQQHIGKDLVRCGFAEAVKTSAKKKTKAESEMESGNADA